MCLYFLYWLFQVMVRLQTAMGAEGVRWSPHVTRTIRSHMAARHSTLQQVSSSAASCFGFWLIWIHIDLIYTYRSGTACCRERKKERKRERKREWEREREKERGERKKERERKRDTGGRASTRLTHSGFACWCAMQIAISIACCFFLSHGIWQSAISIVRWF